MRRRRASVPISPDETEGLVYMPGTCHRCNGYGALLAEDNTQVPCPICKGTGNANYFMTEGNPNAPLPVNKRYADGAARPRRR